MNTQTVAGRLQGTPPPAALGARLAEARRASGLTQADAARAVGISRVAVGYAEQGRRTPRLSTLGALAALYGTSASALLAGEGDRRGSREEGEER